MGVWTVGRRTEEKERRGRALEAVIEPGSPRIYTWYLVHSFQTGVTRFSLGMSEGAVQEYPGHFLPVFREFLWRKRNTSASVME